MSARFLNAGLVARNIRTARPQPFLQYAAVRHVTDTSNSGNKGPDNEHATTKKDNMDAQSSSAMAGQESRANSTGASSATSQKDTNNSNEKAKQEMPEAPDVVIGMNSERGGKGA